MSTNWPARAASAREALLVPTLLVLMLAAPVASATSVPPGFEETVVASGAAMSSLRAFTFAPDGDIFIGSGFGWVWRVHNGVVAKISEIPVYFFGEAGLGGMMVDPDYATNHRIWILYTAPSSTSMHVSHFTWNGTTLVNEQLILEWTETSPWHNGGCLRFASDKTLFISTGDDYLRSETSQNPHDLRGKILHINRDGTPAAGNPYLDGVNGDPRVWATGFRNPFRFNLQPHTETLFIADVGDGVWEELSIGIPGGNFGWANIEGPQPAGQPGYVYPIYWYDHSDPVGAAITGGDHADEGDFSEDYHGDYFFGDSSRSQLFRMRLDHANQPISTELWATEAHMPVDIQFGPDGSLYYATYSDPAELRKISYVGGTNGQPIAAASVTPDAGLAPLATVLDGSESRDPDGDPMDFFWDLSDGGKSNERVASHEFGPGVYRARLVVTDMNGGSDVSPEIRIVSGNERPNAAIAAPGDGSRYNAAQVITYSGSGMDAEDGNLDCSRFSWTVTFHHLGHVHPFVGPLQGSCAGSFTTDDRSETSIHTHYEVRLSVQDAGTPLGSDGILAGTQVVEIHPSVTSMALASTPYPELQLILDTQPVVTPLTVEGVVNFVRVVDAPPNPQLAADGHTYTWRSWSDGGARRHEIRLGALLPPSLGFGEIPDLSALWNAPPTLTADFACDVIQEVPGLQLGKVTSDGETVRFTWDPVTDPCLTITPSRYQIYAASTPKPVGPPGSFPSDPIFHLVGDSMATSFTYMPEPNDAYFLVVAVGNDGLPGRAGHYGD